MRSSISRSSSRSRMIPQLPGGVLWGGGRGVRGGVASPRTHTILRGQVVVAQGDGRAGVSTGGRKGADRSRLDLLRR